MRFVQREQFVLSSFVGGGVVSLSVSRMFGYKRSLISVITESLSIVYTCTDVSLIAVVTMVSLAVSSF